MRVPRASACILTCLITVLQLGGTAKSTVGVSATQANALVPEAILQSDFSLSLERFQYASRDVPDAGLPPVFPPIEAMPLGDIKAISGGGEFDGYTCALTMSGGVKCWGDNSEGQLGNGTKANNWTPGDVIGLSEGVQAISAGGYHTCALMISGAVKCWGSNAYGQLGDGTTEDRLSPVDVQGLTGDVIAIDAGGFYTCVLTSSGGVKCWGPNGSGQLGDGTTNTRLAPVDVVGLTTGVQAISAGRLSTCALTTVGSVKCWGANSAGQLGDGTTEKRLTPVPVVGLSSGAKQVSIGSFHACALTATNGIKCWGANGSGRLGDGTTTDRLTPVDVTGLATGVRSISVPSGFFGGHTCALTLAGSVKCWGNNSYGQLGIGEASANRTTPTDVLGLSIGVQAVAAGGLFHTCALLLSGHVKCWGNNESGELGDGQLSQSHVLPAAVTGVPDGIVSIDAGYGETCVLTASGAVSCWGGREYIPSPINAWSSGIKSVNGGGEHTCALAANGGVTCRGLTTWGQLGEGTLGGEGKLEPVGVTGLISGVEAMDAGFFHTCAATANRIKCWGANTYGQLGNGTTEEVSTVPVDIGGADQDVQAIGAGADHTCVVTNAGGVRCWGNNDGGQLGDGTRETRLSPVDVVGLDSEIQAVAAGMGHTCALTVAGGVKCWGSNRLGQLGDTTKESQLTPVDVYSLDTGVVAISAGQSHTCALLDTGLVKCWGWNYFGQLGDGTYDDRVFPVYIQSVSRAKAIGAGGYHTCAVLVLGGVQCWGSNQFGQVGMNPGWLLIDVVTCRSYMWHRCAYESRVVAGRVSYNGNGLKGATVAAGSESGSEVFASTTTDDYGYFVLVFRSTVGLFGIRASHPFFDFSPRLHTVFVAPDKPDVAAIDFMAAPLGEYRTILPSIFAP